MNLPAYVFRCLSLLESAGFPTYAVGGCVRDYLLGKEPHDFDLCTAALPEEIQAVFSGFRLSLAGIKHGTVGVVTPGGLVEITTFRTEGGYQDGRHPEWVSFVSSIEEDLARRDFTINAMAYSPIRGLRDPFGGQVDLQSKLLRAVGDPERRFSEDALRILRGVRFAAVYQLSVDAETEKAMLARRGQMDDLARERVFEELCKLLPQARASLLIQFAPILAQAVPELAPTLGFLQHNPHHAYDVFTHTAHVVEAVPPALPLRWAALLHDIGKPAVFTMDALGCGHFKGHAQVSAELADQALRSLKASAALREAVVKLIGLHMLELEPDKKLLRRRVSKYGLETIEALLALQRADFGGKGTGTNTLHPEFDQTAALLREIREEDACLTVSGLAVTGRDLIALGYVPGKALGRCLDDLLTQVLEERLPNERQALLAAAEDALKKISYKQQEESL